MEGKNKPIDTGCLCLAVLTAIFVFLKYTKQISWSWLWVLSPLWIPLALTILVLLVLFVSAIIILLRKGEKK